MCRKDRSSRPRTQVCLCMNASSRTWRSCAVEAMLGSMPHKFSRSWDSINRSGRVCWKKRCKKGRTRKCKVDMENTRVRVCPSTRCLGNKADSCRYMDPDGCSHCSSRALPYPRIAGSHYIIRPIRQITATRAKACDCLVWQNQKAAK